MTHKLQKSRKHSKKFHSHKYIYCRVDTTVFPIITRNISTNFAGQVNFFSSLLFAASSIHSCYWNCCYLSGCFLYSCCSRCAQVLSQKAADEAAASPAGLLHERLLCSPSVPPVVFALSPFFSGCEGVFCNVFE